MSKNEVIHQFKCRQCEVNVESKDQRKVFCSQSCAAKYNNSRRPRRKHEYFCRMCNASLLNTANKHFCSNQCQGAWTWNQTKQEIIRTGVYKGADYNSIRLLARKFIEETSGWKCSICQSQEWMGQKIPLVVDHANGNPEDNRIENIRLVCGNCNMQLPTFAGRNRGNGRSWRKDKRLQGKNA